MKAVYAGMQIAFEGYELPDVESLRTMAKELRNQLCIRSDVD